MDAQIRSYFPFFSLPPETRNMFYSIALTSSPLRTRCSNASKRWTRLGLVADIPPKQIAPSTNLLLANRLTYHEASHILYHHGHFSIPVFVFNTLDAILCKPPGVTNPLQPVKTFSSLATKAPYKHLSGIRNIDIEIHWFRSTRGTIKNRSVRGTMDSVCRGLCVFTSLNTVTVTWQSYSADPVRLKGVELFDCWARQRALELLQSFRDFRCERPEVAVVVEASKGLRKVLVGRNDVKVRRRARGLEECLGGLEALGGLGS